MSAFTDKDPKAETVAGKPLRCPICQHDRFWSRPTMLPRRALAIMDIEWAAPKAVVHACARCRHLLWFLPER
jgi:hypothetical protein